MSEYTVVVRDESSTVVVNEDHPTVTVQGQGIQGPVGPAGADATAQDTGWLLIPDAQLLNGWARSLLGTAYGPWIRRVGNSVKIQGWVRAAAATSNHFYTAPVGFRPGLPGFGSIAGYAFDSSDAEFTTGEIVTIADTGDVAVEYAGMTGFFAVALAVEWFADDDFPA